MHGKTFCAPSIRLSEAEAWCKRLQAAYSRQFAGGRQDAKQRCFLVIFAAVVTDYSDAVGIAPAHIVGHSPAVQSLPPSRPISPAASRPHRQPLSRKSAADWPIDHSLVESD
jgi:hypothetical protein